MEDEMDMTHSTYGREKECVQRFGRQSQKDKGE
jgi:hypothetical protein